MTQDKKNDIDCMFIIALPEEFEVFKEKFNPMQKEKWPHKGSCWTHTLNDASGKNLTCKTLVMEDQGPENASKITSIALGYFSPKILISIGISGKINDDVKLMDVVLADSVDNPFYRGKVKVGKINFAGEVVSLKRLTDLAWKTINDDGPVLRYGSEISSKILSKLKIAGLIESQPTFKKGPICTTPLVIDDAKFQSFISESRNRLILACDMESASVANAASEFNLGDENILIIRGISDPADGRKSLIDSQGKGTIRRAAMLNATMAAYHFLSSLDLQGKIAKSSTKSEEQRVSDLGIYSLINRINELFPNNLPNSSTSMACSKLEKDLLENNQLKEEIIELSKAAYDQQILSILSYPINLKLNKITLTGQDYLIARHIMRGIVHNRNLKDRTLFDPLSHVYPYRINRFCKAILNSLNTLRDTALTVANLITVYENSGNEKRNNGIKHRYPDTVKAHVCYLLGRVEDHQQKPIAVKSLSKWIYEFSSVPRNESLERSLRSISKTFSVDTPAKRMLLRTTLISLVLLGELAWEAVYVELCLRNKEFDELNRGFHLEYYGDIPFDPTAMMNHDDNLCSMSKTYDILSSKIKESYSKKKPYLLRNLELQTLLSLCQHRQADGKLDDSVRDDLLLFLDSIPNQDLSTLPILRGHAALVQDALRLDSRPFDLLKKIHGLKKMPRTGWNNSVKGRSVTMPETIMSHIGGGLMLIHLCLPHKLSKRDINELGVEVCSKYSKDQILKMFLVHDLAEAYTDDLLPENKNPITNDNEKLVMSMIDSFSTLPGFEMASTYALWHEFEQAANINSKIAKEIDALDNLVQLLIEKNQYDSIIPDFEIWRNGLRMRINTPVCKRILNLIDPI